MTLYFSVSGCSAVALHSKIAMVAMENKEIFISRVWGGLGELQQQSFTAGDGDGVPWALLAAPAWELDPQEPRSTAVSRCPSQRVLLGRALLCSSCAGRPGWQPGEGFAGIMLGVPFPAPYGPAICWGAKQRARSFSRDLLWTLGVFFAKLFIYSSNTWMTPPLRWSLFCQSSLFDFLY